jgi:hypothetical protein
MTFKIAMYLYNKSNNNKITKVYLISFYKIPFISIITMFYKTLNSWENKIIVWFEDDFFHRYSQNNFIWKYWKQKIFHKTKYKFKNISFYVKYLFVYIQQEIYKILNHNNCGAQDVELKIYNILYKNTYKVKKKYGRRSMNYIFSYKYIGLFFCCLWQLNKPNMAIIKTLKNVFPSWYVQYVRIRKLEIRGYAVIIWIRETFIANISSARQWNLNTTINIK